MAEDRRLWQAARRRTVDLARSLGAEEGVVRAIEESPQVLREEAVEYLAYITPDPLLPKYLKTPEYPGGYTPVSDVVDWLGSPEGEGWLEDTLARYPLSESGYAYEVFPRFSATPGDLTPEQTAEIREVVETTRGVKLGEAEAAVRARVMEEEKAIAQQYADRIQIAIEGGQPDEYIQGIRREAKSALYRFSREDEDYFRFLAVEKLGTPQERAGHLLFSAMQGAPTEFQRRYQGIVGEEGVAPIRYAPIAEYLRPTYTPEAPRAEVTAPETLYRRALPEFEAPAVKAHYERAYPWLYGEFMAKPWVSEDPKTKEVQWTTFLKQYPWLEEWKKKPPHERGEYPSQFKPRTRWLNF